MCKITGRKRLNNTTKNAVECELDNWKYLFNVDSDSAQHKQDNAADYVDDQKRKRAQMEYQDVKMIDVQEQDEYEDLLENEAERKFNIFQLDDESFDLNFPHHTRELSVSEASEEDLFINKSQMQKTEDDSQQLSSFTPSIQQMKSENLFPFLNNDNYILSNISKEEKQRVRKQKVTKYLQKKITRTKRKKTTYHSRRTVSQTRLRVKGRFITKSQAQNLLSSDLSHLFNNQIKQLLEINCN